MAHASSMKSVAAACLACAFAAQAAPVTVPVGGSFTGMDPAGSGQVTTVSLIGGSGSWDLGNGGGWTEQWYWGIVDGLVGVFNTYNIKVLGIGEIHPTEELWTNFDIEETFRTHIHVPTQAASVTLDSVTGQVTSVANVGAVQFKGTRISGTLTGGTATISNLRFDLTNQTVVADLTGLRGAVGTRPSVAYNMPNTALWTFANVATGSEVIDSTTFASTLTFSGLSVTSKGLEFLTSSLGQVNGTLSGPINEDVKRIDLRYVDDYGSIHTRLVFSTAVPEPSTYALLGVGLVGLLVGLRRRVAEN